MRSIIGVEQAHAKPPVRLLKQKWTTKHAKGAKMKITIASGKGGTGKTTFAVNLAWALAHNGATVQLLDADVEEPNSHLFVHPDFSEERDVKVLKPVWDQEKCTGCGIAAEACQYNALAVVNGKVLIFNELCHACGVCTNACPEGALTEQPHTMGKVRIDPDSGNFFFADGLLNVGEPSAPTVIKELKQTINPDAISIIDAAPGTGCPVVEAVDGADVAILVTEPTPFGLHDLKLAVGLTLKMKVPTGIVVNRSDGKDKLIADYAAEIGLPIVGRIPFKRAYAETYSRGEIIAQNFPEMRENMVAIYDGISALAETQAPPEPAEAELSTTTAQQKTFAPGNSQEFKEIAIISGKGGTGKTTISASLMQLATQVVMADNDVDAADLHLLLKPSVYEIHDFFGGSKAVIDPQKCVGCGLCEQACHFDAIDRVERTNGPALALYQVDEMGCEGCTLCQRVCPARAITMHEERTGAWYVAETEFGPMVYARLGIAQENSGKLVTRVRQRAAELTQELNYEVLIADGPPGTSCPVIASITGVDQALIVTEPTVSGIHDLKRVLNLCKHFGVPASVIINKADLNAEQAQHIYQLTSESGGKVIGEVPFDRNVHEALMEGKTVLEFGNCPASEAIRNIWNKLGINTD